MSPTLGKALRGGLMGHFTSRGGCRYGPQQRTEERVELSG